MSKGFCIVAVHPRPQTNSLSYVPSTPHQHRHTQNATVSHYAGIHKNSPRSQCEQVDRDDAKCGIYSEMKGEVKSVVIPMDEKPGASNCTLQLLSVTLTAPVADRCR